MLEIVDIDDALDCLDWAKDRVRGVIIQAIEFAIGEGIDPDTLERNEQWKVLQQKAEESAKTGDVYRTLMRCYVWEDQVRLDCRGWIMIERVELRKSMTGSSSAF